MNVAVLGPGGVGGFVAGALARAGTPTTVVAREATAERIARDGLRVESVRLGVFTVHPAVTSRLATAPDVLVVAVKAPALEAALERIAPDVQPGLVVPLLNGVDHVARLRERFPGPGRVAAGSIRIGAHRPEPGRVVHTSAFFRLELAPDIPPVRAFAHVLRAAELPTAVRASEADVLWSKLSRLCALALATAASGLTLGEIRAHPRWRPLLEGAAVEAAAVARAEGADVDTRDVLAELADWDAGMRSSLARDVDAGVETELDAIGGAVLRAAARHGLACPSVAELVERVLDRVR
jgi:2-dehydropantoate 2-reductase